MSRSPSLTVSRFHENGRSAGLGRGRGRPTGNAAIDEGTVEWCYDTIGAVSRTFALTVEALEEPMAREVCVGYLVCRVADTVEDDPRIPPAEKAALLRTYDRTLAPDTDTDGTEFRRQAKPWFPADPGPDWEVVANAPRVLGALDGLGPTTRARIVPPVREMVGGMATFVDRYADEPGLRVQTAPELEEYCQYAAGTVGTLVTSLVAAGADTPTTDRLRETARSFGLLLQVVNVAKDAGGDYTEEDNVYLPAAWLEAAGVTPADLGDPAAADRVAPVIERATAHAETYLDDAQAWLEAMPEDRGNRLSAWATPYLLAVGTIRELTRRPADAVREGDVKVERAEVAAVLSAFEAGATAADLGDLRAKVRERPLQEY
ncbi:MAG: farnesyl-diphosphate farnesyltransferase [Salinirussus sp.]|jgi:farnesyl-diphosphate farnesyltransferase